jgi:sporulation protein YlmC with PRC-barrel domain
MEDTMKSKYIAIALLSTALMTGIAYAQTSTTATADKANSSATMHKEGQWRSSKLIGVDVYNEANEKIGDIQELILDKFGKVEHVVLGVGGFLGMGEHYVAVAFDKLKLVNEPVRSTLRGTPEPGVGGPIARAVGFDLPEAAVAGLSAGWFTGSSSG